MVLTIFGPYYFTDHILLFANYKTPGQHRHFAKHLIFGLDRNIECTVENEKIFCRGICIQSNTIHTVCTKKTKTLVLLIDETSIFARLLDSLYFQGNSYKTLDKMLAENVAALCRNYTDIETLKKKILSIYGIESSPPVFYDDRIRDVLLAIENRDSIDENVFEYLCGIACLSQSRLSHLFREQMKIPLASYLVIAKMQKTYNYIVRGEDLTTASVHAGFYSASHFAATCKKMFGLSFSDFYKQ